MSHTATDVQYPGRWPGRILHLLTDQRQQVARLQAIADLMPFPAETDVLEWPTVIVRVDPIGKNSLINFAELAGAREHAAAIDEDRQIKSGPVLQRQKFRGAFGSAVQ